MQNALDTGEFVYNIVTYDLAAQMNISATTLPAEVDEFAKARLTPGACKMVKAPRVLESPISFECKVSGIHELEGDVGPGSVIVFGRVVYMHFADNVLLPDNKIDPVALDPIGRLSGPSYAKVRDLFHIERPNWSKDVDPTEKK